MPSFLLLLDLQGLTSPREHSTSIPESFNNKLGSRQFDLNHFSSLRNGKILFLDQLDEFIAGLNDKMGTLTSMVA